MKILKKLLSNLGPNPNSLLRHQNSDSGGAVCFMAVAKDIEHGLAPLQAVSSLDCHQ